MMRARLVSLSWCALLVAACHPPSGDATATDASATPLKPGPAVSRAEVSDATETPEEDASPRAEPTPPLDEVSSSPSSDGTRDTTLAPASSTSPAATSDGALAASVSPSDAGLPPDEPLRLQPQVVTSGDQAFWVTGTYEKGASSEADVTVSDSGDQPWHGFGGTFNEAGWDALSVLTDAERNRAMKLLFDETEGANFTFGRIPIGASDYALSPYALNDTPNDTAMTDFTIERDRDNLIPYIKAALAFEPSLRLWASPWTPPAWMKTNNRLDAVPSKSTPYADSDGVMKGDSGTLAAYALYLERFVQEYAKEDISVSAIHPQDEPGIGNAYPSCYWPADLYITFIRDYLGPRFNANLPEVELWAGTMGLESDGELASALAEDPTALSYITGFGLQWNTMSRVEELLATGRLVMQTSHKGGNYSWSQNYWDAARFDPEKPQNDYAYGVESWKLIRDWVNAGVSAYSAWNMVLDSLGTNLNTVTPWHQNALLVVDRDKKELTVTPAYYVFRHLSQYVEPGSTVVATSGGDALAFKKGERYVVVVYNEGDAKQIVVAVGGEKLQVDVPSNGWATIVYPN